VIKQEAPGLALFGRQAIDDDMGAVAAQVAELLGWPCASWIMEEAVDDSGKAVRVARQTEGGLEVFDLPLPAVVSAQKGLNEPRYPTLKGIMGAKKKEIKDVKAADLGITPEPPALSVVKLEALPPRPPGRILPGSPRTPSRSWSARSAKTPKRSKRTGDPNPMAGAFWCIVEDDRQGNPKKVMAEVLGEAARLAGRWAARRRRCG
jgi:hypothetical protein